MTHRTYVEHGAIVSAGAAWLISRILTSPSVNKVVTHPPGWLNRAQIEETVEAIHQAGREFEASSAALERGNETLLSAVMARSELTTREAADYLGLSPRRVQEIAAELGGTRAGRQWRIPAVAVREYGERQRQTAA